MENRILGALMGVAVGDALGATLEFQPRSKNWNDHTEIIGGGVFGWEEGYPTDDTEMMIAVAKGILDRPKNPLTDILQYFERLRVCQRIMVGDTVHLALEYGAEEAHRMLKGKSAGNDSLMRVIPVPLAYYETEDIMEKIAAGQSKITHYSTEASTACILYSKLVRALLTRPENLDERMPKKYYPKVLFGNSPYGEMEYEYIKYGELDPSGYVLDSFKCALWCFINTNSFEEALVRAVNLGGDADTIGAITGGIAGAFYGLDNIPERWLDKLKTQTLLERLGRQLIEFKGMAGA